MAIEIRSARGDDRRAIMETLVEAFYSEFKPLSSSRSKLIDGLAHAVRPERFLVAVERTGASGDVVGTVAIVLGGKSPLEPEGKLLARHGGLVHGHLGGRILQREMSAPIKVRPEDAYLSCVAVKKSHRGYGIATRLIDAAVREVSAPRYLLDVMAGNEKVLKLYRKEGFEILGESKEPFGKLKGFGHRYILAKNGEKPE